MKASGTMALLLLSLAQSHAPEFTASSVLPANARRAEPLRPGMLVSIYGRYLGPAAGCTERASGNERSELCGSSVTAGGVKAGLLYVQDAQINLRVPVTAPTEGLVSFVVTHEGRSSAPVAVRFAPYPVRISLVGEAYVNMPIWIEVVLPEPLRWSLRYPITIWPADFGGHDLQVRRNGVALPRLRANDSMGKSSGCIGGTGSIGVCGPISLPHEPRNRGRLPLHLLYRFDKPGSYEVRYQGYDFRVLYEKHVLARSPWLHFEIHNCSEARRTQWLATMQRTVPKDPVELVSEFLPSILALPDAAVLPLVEDSLYDANNIVRDYSVYALYGFSDSLIAGRIPDLVRRRGVTPNLAYFLSWKRVVFQTEAANLSRSALAHLSSSEPLLRAGAIKALEFLRPATGWPMDAAVLQHAESLIGRHDSETLQYLAEYLGGIKTDRSRSLLWRLVEEGQAREQALICLTWIADPRDVPRLGRYKAAFPNLHVEPQ
jgi:hypothetical protein